MIASATADLNAVSFAVLVMRVVAGVAIGMHGYNHIWGGGKIAGTARWFGSMGMKPPILHAWLASLTELAAAVSLILGLFMPLGGAAILSVMVVAFMVNHRGNGFFIFRPGEGWEYVLVLGTVGLMLGSIGGFKYSLDHVLDFSWDFGGVGPLLVTAIAGFGGAFGLLAACWRPEKKADEKAA